MKDTKIEWCDHSWSPWRGCTKVSAGCANCYAETLSKRNPAVLGEWGKGKPRVKAKNWNEPRTWNKAACDQHRIISCEECMPKTVFPSLCDIFDEEVEAGWLADFFQLVHETPNLTWLLLTKRPELFLARLGAILNYDDVLPDRPKLAAWLEGWRMGKPPTNVWMGTSVEDQPNADRRIPALLRIPAVGRFLSLEPLLGPVDLWGARYPRANGGQAGAVSSWKPSVDWLIVGGESGPGARPCNVEWVRAIVRDGKAAGVPTFVKQLGARPVEDIHDQRGGYLGFQRPTGITHPKGGDPAQWPEDLRVREFPAR